MFLDIFLSVVFFVSNWDYDFFKTDYPDIATQLEKLISI